MNFMNDTSLKPGKPLKNIVYHAVDWNCMSYNNRLYETLEMVQGDISPDIMKSRVLPKTQTGEMQSVIYHENGKLMKNEFSI